jgi:hypothetical protein
MLTIEIEDDFRVQPSFPRRAATQTGRFFGSLFKEGLPKLIPYTERKIAESLGMQQVPDERRSWYNRYEPVSSDGVSFRNIDWRDVGRQTASDIPRALSYSIGAPGGAGAWATRSVRRPISQLARTGGSYLFNREVPSRIWQDAIQTGEYAPAITDSAAFLGGIGAGRAAAYALRPATAAVGRLPRVRRASSTIVPIGAGIVGGIAGWKFSSPFAEGFGGNPDGTAIFEGARLPNDPDWVYDRNGNRIFDPPIGKYPDWDRYNRGIG